MGETEQKYDEGEATQRMIFLTVRLCNQSDLCIANFDVSDFVSFVALYIHY